jgi:hypothetical protein
MMKKPLPIPGCYLVMLVVAGLLVGAQLVPRPGNHDSPGKSPLQAAVPASFVVQEAFGRDGGGHSDPIAFASSSDPGLRTLARLLTKAGPQLQRDYANLLAAARGSGQEQVVPGLQRAITRLRSDDLGLRNRLARARVSSRTARRAQKLSVRSKNIITGAEQTFASALIDFGSARSLALLQKVRSSLRRSGRSAGAALKLLGCLRRCEVAL